MGKCCGASSSEKRGERSQSRQRDLQVIVENLDEPMREPPRGSDVSTTRTAQRTPPTEIVAPVEQIPIIPIIPVKPKVTDIGPAWKRQRQVRVADDYGEMVFDTDNLAKGGVAYNNGVVPSVKDDASSRNQAFATFSEEDKQVVGIAKQVLTGVRDQLPLGPFNNYGNLPDEVLERQNKPGTDQHAPGWWNSVVEVAAGKGAEALHKTLPEVNEYKLEMACLARATREVGGGVCSKMAMVTTGALSTAMPPGSEIVQVFSSYDHEFVIARAPGSRWFVVDPWCQEPLVIPFVDCYFQPDSVKKFIALNVTQTAPPELPFGIDVETVDWHAIVEQAKAEMPAETPLNLGHEFGQANNANKPGQFDPALKSVGREAWG